MGNNACVPKERCKGFWKKRSRECRVVGDYRIQHRWSGVNKSGEMELRHHGRIFAGKHRGESVRPPRWLVTIQSWSRNLPMRELCMTFKNSSSSLCFMQERPDQNCPIKENFLIWLSKYCMRYQRLLYNHFTETDEHMKGETKLSTRTGISNIGYSGRRFYVDSEVTCTEWEVVTTKICLCHIAITKPRVPVDLSRLYSRSRRPQFPTFRIINSSS